MSRRWIAVVILFSLMTISAIAARQAAQPPAKSAERMDTSARGGDDEESAHRGRQATGDRQVDLQGEMPEVPRRDGKGRRA